MAGISSKAAGKTENKYKYNGKELNNKEFSDGSGLELYEFGARLQDPQLGKWWVPDLMSDKAPSLTPYRYGFNNPVRFLDPNGMYETDGHFWTVYLMANLMGSADAFRIARNTEAPDNIMNRDGDVISSPNTWLNITDQRTIHALNGGSSALTRAFGTYQVENAGNYGELGNALHYLGDSYAHSVMGNEGKMYSNGRGHLFDWHDPDKIALRPDLYKAYVNNLSLALGKRLGFKGQLDTYTFDYISKGGTTEQNSAVLETEIRLREGVKNFSVEGNQVGTIGNYLKDRNSHYGTTVSYKAVSTIVTTYTRNGNGEWQAQNEEKTLITFK